jgi:2'-5' RNA ligase
MSVEDKYAQTISIVYPAVAPNDKYKLPIDRKIKSHVTISILGQIPETTFSKDELIAALSHVSWERVEEAPVEHLALFGPERDYLVMQLDSPALQRNWKRVNEALEGVGISSLDKYPSYRPHITLQHDYDGPLPTPDFLPSTVKIGAATLWWGRETILLN